MTLTTQSATKAGRSKAAKARKQLTADQLFFYEHAGYSYNPQTETAEQGRIRCAISLALAEEQARNLGYEFEWEYDECPDLSWMSDEEREQEHEVLCCRIPDPDRPRYSLASLCGITDPDSNYCRSLKRNWPAKRLLSWTRRLKRWTLTNIRVPHPALAWCGTSTSIECRTLMTSNFKIAAS